MIPGSESAIVTGEGGWTGRLEPAHPLLVPGGVSVPQVLVRVDNGGPTLVLPARTLERGAGGVYYLPFTREALEAYVGTTTELADETMIIPVPNFAAGDPEAAAAVPPPPPAATSAPSAPPVVSPPPAVSPPPPTRAENTESVVVPVMGEEVDVQKRVVETGVVRVHKTVGLRQETVDEPLVRQEVQVERVPINRVLEGGAPPVRHEGDTMIIPLLEEVLVVEKRLMLREELRVTRTQQEFHAPQQVILRREEVTVDRVSAESSAGTGPAPDPLPGSSQIEPGQASIREQETLSGLERQ